ncbi:MAG: ABC transporter permease [Micropruina sp.]|uniref:ABC transporter permease n=1 Tax=Micropruina sp. TaxID=2737536 RepID=UPI0039E50088
MTRGWRQARTAALTLVHDALLGLTAKPARTVGMVAGILLATASTVAAIMISDTQQAQIDRRFDLQRSPAIVLQASGSLQAGIDAHGMAALAGLEPVSAAGELSIWQDSVSVAANRYAKGTGGPLVVADAGGLAAAGATVTGMESTGLALDRPLVWLGATLADQLGVRPDDPTTVMVAGRTYSLAGVLTETTGFEYLKTSVVMGRSTATRLAPSGRIERIIAHVRPGSAAAVAGYALAALDPTQQLGLRDVTPPDGEVLLGNVATDLRMIGLALGGFVGFVGIIAVANTMSTSVNQRSHELGLRAAMGWRPNRVRALIMVESVLAGVAASIFGCALGMAGALVWALIQGWQPILAKELPPIVIVAGTLAAWVGGAIPAHHAASISPLTAMRS